MTIKWMTYRQRIQADLDDAFSNDNATDFFGEDYVRQLSEPLKQQDEWLLKLFALQFAILSFLLVGFGTADATFSVFGISLKQTTGLKEVLLVMSATIGVAIMVISSARDTAIFLIQGICKRLVDPRYIHFAKFAFPVGFHFRMYHPREYERWQFSTIAGKGTSVAVGVLAILVGLALFALSFIVQWIIIKDIWKNPTLGNWSYFALAYVALVYALNLLVAIKLYVPFPYHDKSALRTTPLSRK